MSNGILGVGLSIPVAHPNYADLGAGDLHRPLGWGDIPWARIAETCSFPQGVVGDIELQQRYWSELPETIHHADEFTGSLGQE